MNCTLPMRIAAIESGRGIALYPSMLKKVAGDRLRYRPVTGITEVVPVGIVRARNGDVTPAGEKFCAILRKIAKGMGHAFWVLRSWERERERSLAPSR